MTKITVITIVKLIELLDNIASDERLDAHMNHSERCSRSTREQYKELEKYLSGETNGNHGDF